MASTELPAIYRLSADAEAHITKQMLIVAGRTQDGALYALRFACDECFVIGHRVSECSLVAK